MNNELGSMNKEEGKKKIVKFTDLDAWQEAHKLVLMIYDITKKFPKEETFGLTNQMRRKVQFYSMSQGSVTEIQNQLLAAKDIGYILEEEFNKIIEQTVKVHKIINGLIKKSKTLIPNS